MRYVRLHSCSVLTVLGFLMLLAGCSDSAQSSADEIILDEEKPVLTSRIIAMHSNECLMIEGDSVSDGAATERRKCERSKAAMFDFVPVPGQVNVYAIKTSLTGMCLSIFQQSQEQDAALVQSQCGEGINQYFKLKDVEVTDTKGDVEPHHYQLEVQHSKQCIDVNQADTTDSAKVVQHTCQLEPESANQSDQAWYIPGNGGEDQKGIPRGD